MDDRRANRAGRLGGNQQPADADCGRGRFSRRLPSGMDRAADQVPDGCHGRDQKQPGAMDRQGEIAMSDEVERIKAVYRRRMELDLSKRYSLFSPGELYTLHRREQAIVHLLRRAGITDLAALHVLEVGCGRGRPLADWTRWGASARNLHGIDIMEPSIRQAVELLPRATLVVGSANRLPFPDRSFDIVAQLTMFTSILDRAMRHAAAAEMQRVLAPAGAILWYDFRYPSPFNRDVRPVRLHEIRALFPGWRIDSVTTTLLPPLARRLARISFQACAFLESALPPLRSHHLALLTRPG